MKIFLWKARSDFMDIAKVSIAMNQAHLQQQASLAVLKKAMNTAEMNANGLIEMLNQSVAIPHPYKGGSIDIKA